MVAPLAPHVSPSQSSELRFDERHQTLERTCIAIAPRPQQFRDRAW
jgi:hypothetical protein